MGKKVLIISTSLRPNANSEILARETERGAKDAGHEVEFVTLKDKVINFCKGCLACQKLGKCVINDDANEITSKMKEADVIVWATPVLIVHGENAHSRYFGETAYHKLKGDNKELFIVKGANHVDLYDGGDKNVIPFDKIESFYKENLK